MEFLKSLFDNGAITWEQFSQAVTEKGYKLADLATGNYVDKKKFDDAVSTRDTTITELNTQIKTRDKDIKALQTQLTDGGKDSETKITELTSQLEKLQGEYNTAKTDFEKRLSAQSYDFAVNEYANTKKFTSAAARKQFVQEMRAENLKMKDKTIIGADDFFKVWQEGNTDAIVPAEPKQEEEPQQQQAPVFIQPTPPQPGDTSDNPFADAFNFAGVRAHETK